MFYEGVKLGLLHWRQSECRCCFINKIWYDNRNCVSVINGKVINDTRGTLILVTVIQFWAHMAIHIKEYEMGKAYSTHMEDYTDGRLIFIFFTSPPIRNQSIHYICIHKIMRVTFLGLCSRDLHLYFGGINGYLDWKMNPRTVPRKQSVVYLHSPMQITTSATESVLLKLQYK